MTLLCGWFSFEGPNRVPEVVRRMGAALRVGAPTSWGSWHVGSLGVGLWEHPEREEIAQVYRPATDTSQRFWLWMAGEVFAGGRYVGEADAESSRTYEFRARLLGALVERGPEALADLDGEYHLVLWDAEERKLVLFNDRFGGLPLYWGKSRQGFAFAAGVRGVLMAPGIGCSPDPEAIREAVTFGGFRLGTRTNVLGVEMLPGASILEITPDSVRHRRYWFWPAPPESGSGAFDPDELAEKAAHLWRQSVGRRLRGARRPGQTLSGGLDSRAILAEAASRTARWVAITYGIPGCDDARYAWRAAEAAGATWVFHPLYRRPPDWLEQRTAYVQATDGLVELADLMHLEALPLQAELLDVHLSGYLGDASCGLTYVDVESIFHVLLRLPYYETELGLSWDDAMECLLEATRGAPATPPRFWIFEHKYPQAINRWSAAWRPWLRVRKPFTDYECFDFWASLPVSVRREGRFYERFLARTYPAFFGSIPNQKTGMPVLTPGWRVQLERGRRFLWRTAQPWLAKLGLPARPRIRAYTDDFREWSRPAVRARIEATILRSDSLVCEIFERRKVERLVQRWFERGEAPAQAVGALYVFEVYHQGLPAFLRRAAKEADELRPS